MKQFRKELSKTYLGADEAEDDEGVNELNKQLLEKNVEEDEEMKKQFDLLKRDPNAKQEVMRAGHIASKNALKSGLTMDEV